MPLDAHTEPGPELLGRFMATLQQLGVLGCVLGRPAWSVLVGAGRC